MDNNLIEIAILGVVERYLNFDDSDYVMSKIVDDADWFSVTPEELKVLQDNRYLLAPKMGVSNILIVTKPTVKHREITTDFIKEKLKEFQAAEAERLRKAEAAKKRARAREQERKVTLAKKAIARAEKVLKEAGVEVVTHK